MSRFTTHARPNRRRAGVFLTLGLCAGWVLLSAPSPAAFPVKGKGAAAATPEPASQAIPAFATAETWKNVPMKPVSAAEIDALVNKELQARKIEPAALTTDEQFIRRVSLDLTGQLPLPADVEEFVADKDPRKRARLIDKLLASDEYAHHWARYWHDVLTAKLIDFRDQILARSFEEWLEQEFKANKGWDQVARAMITADGTCRFDDNGKNGAVFFLASHHGADAANEQAAETSRIFLGIQIQCAQCHDHPSDQWKRVQFHELAGYFARVAEKPVRDDKKLVGTELVSRPRGEHQMPSKEDPKKTFTTYPRFLDGKAPGRDLGDVERRKALADVIVDKNNYWFAAAYVNRIWGEMMGQAFCQPVDDMGPQKQALFPDVLTRLAASFRATNYDTRAFFRTVLNTQTYQRQIRLGDSSDAHLQFAAAYPTKLGADALWDSLVGVLGRLGPPVPANQKRPAGPRAGLEGLFKLEFSHDPSLKADEVEGSISQALLMMNNPAINQRVEAKGTNLLGRILTAYPQDDEALRMVYLRTLARKPTDKEVEKCRNYIKKAGSRSQGFEDVLWALLNSTEFQTKR